MNKIKLFLFKNLGKGLHFFSRLGISKKTPGASRIYNFFYRLFWPYGKIIEVQGSKMYIDINNEPLNMRRTFEAYASNLVHEEATTDLFKKVVKEGSVVVDLGANIGYFTLLAAKLAGKSGKVYSFEPEPKNYNYLIKNIKLNNYKNIVTTQKAVSDKIGRTKLYTCSYDTGHHTINQPEGIRAYRPEAEVDVKEFIEIETTILDEVFRGKEEIIDVIKMDVEGAEMLALLGMDKILRKNKKLKMFVEFFPLLIEKMGNSPQEFIRKLLEDYYFSIFVIPDDYSEPKVRYTKTALCYSASRGEMIKIDDVEKIMNLCKNKTDHMNLFIKR